MPTYALKAGIFRQSAEKCKPTLATGVGVKKSGLGNRLRKKKAGHVGRLEG
jgi:hypothetical protein